MAFFYVKNDGTASGDSGRYSAEQTGSFSSIGTSGYYPNISSALSATTSPTGGDYIIVSDLHDFDSSSTAITIATPNNTLGVSIVCVSDDDVEVYRTSEGQRARELTSVGNSADVTINGSFNIYGMEFSSVDNIQLRVDGGSGSFNDTKFIIATPGILQMSGQLPKTLNDCEIALNHASASFNIDGPDVVVNRGKVSTTASSVNNLSVAGFRNGGSSVKFNSVDLSAVSGVLIANVGSVIGTDDRIDVFFDLCKLSSTVVRTNEDFKSVHQRVLTTRCSDEPERVEYQYGLTAIGGLVDDDSVIVRSEDPAFAASGVKISYKAVTNSDASTPTPLWFEFPNPRYAELSNPSSDTLRLYLVSQDTLTSKDVWVVASYPGATDKTKANYVSSGNTPSWAASTDPLSNGVALQPDNGSNWLDSGSPLIGYNEYYIDVDTSLFSGSNAVPCVRVFISKPNATIQFSSIYETI